MSYLLSHLKCEASISLDWSLIFYSTGFGYGGRFILFYWFSHSSNSNWVPFVDQVKLKLLEISICTRKCRDSFLVGNRAISTGINHRTLGSRIEVGWEDERWWHNPLRTCRRTHAWGKSNRENILANSWRWGTRVQEQICKQSDLVAA